MGLFCSPGDPDPATRINADPCGSGSGSATLKNQPKIPAPQKVENVVVVFRALLNFLSCHEESQLQQIKAHIRPLIQSILLKESGNNYSLKVAENLKGYRKGRLLGSYFKTWLLYVDSLIAVSSYTLTQTQLYSNPTHPRPPPSITGSVVVNDFHAKTGDLVYLI